MKIPVTGSEGYLGSLLGPELLRKGLEVKGLDTGFYSGIISAQRWHVIWDGRTHPAMTLLGLPWGPLASWDAAGKCFITLAAVISLLAASCLYLLLRVGVKPFFLVAASVFISVKLKGAFLVEPEWRGHFCRLEESLEDRS